MDDEKPGWVKSHRKMLNSAVFDEASGALVKLWMYLLLNSNWDTRQLADGTHLKAGQLVRGFRRIANDLHWTTSKVHRWLSRLQKLGNITTTPRSGTLAQVITICHWETYQGDDSEPGTQAERKRNASGCASGTLAERKGEGKKTRREENKKRKGGSAAFSPADIELPKELDTPQFREAWKSWVQARIEIKAPLTPTAVKLQLKKLAAWGSTRASAALDHTGSNTWKGIREPDAADGGPVRTAPRIDVETIMRQKAAEAGEEYK